MHEIFGLIGDPAIYRNAQTIEEGKIEEMTYDETGDQETSGGPVLETSGARPNEN